MRFYILLFYCFTGFSQQPAVTIVLDSISVQDVVDDEIQYKIFYHVTNNYENEIKFFFDPEGFGQSLSSKKVFFLFENEERFTGDKFLKQITKVAQEKIKADFEKIMLGGDPPAVFKKIGMDIEEFKKRSKEGTIEKYHLELATKMHQKDVMSLKPLETKKFQQILYWQKNRYYTDGDYEFYLNEKSNFKMQFMLILLKDILVNKISKEYFDQIRNDKNFIQGVFYSNKIPIHFKI